MSDVAQHNREIHENLDHWQRKPQLREAYAEFYRMIADRIADRLAGPVVECGSGIGNLKSVIPDAVTTDLFPNPWIDRVENVFALSMADNSVAALILFDVFHHLEYPGTALAEMRRVLAPRREGRAARASRRPARSDSSWIVPPRTVGAGRDDRVVGAGRLGPACGALLCCSRERLAAFPARGVQGESCRLAGPRGRLLSRTALVVVRRFSRPAALSAICAAAGPAGRAGLGGRAESRCFAHVGRP